MKTIQDQSFKRLLKKLSAMRATLQNDEREILDAIVTGEVTAHKLSADRAVRKASADQVAEVAAHKLSADRAVRKASADQVAEVAAHKLSVDRAVRKASADQVAEVAAHKLSADRAVRKASADQVAFRIRIDPSTGQYAQVRD